MFMLVDKLCVRLLGMVGKTILISCYFFISLLKKVFIPHGFKLHICLINVKMKERKQTSVA